MVAIQRDKNSKLFCLPLTVNRGRGTSKVRDDFYSYPSLQLF